MAMSDSSKEAIHPVMPDLTWPRHGFYHTVDSALLNLMQLGISPDRITIHKAGRGWQPLRVVEQQPAAREPLTPDVTVELTVEGDGAFYHLPVGMHEASPEGVIGTYEIVSLFDDAVEKAAVYVRLGGLFFDVRPNNPAGCARWIALFGIDPEAWPRERWYQLAILLPCLSYLAGREKGLRLALRLLLDLEVEAIGWRPRRTVMAKEDRSLLGQRAARLGVDLILGDGVDDEASLELSLGPISVKEYWYFQTNEGQHRLNQVMRLVAPYHWIYDLKWLVGDKTRAPRLGSEIENAVLGVNSHLGLQ
jgi:hypothetical protein